MTPATTCHESDPSHPIAKVGGVCSREGTVNFSSRFILNPSPSNIKYHSNEKRR